jgi:hypothetical protein
MKMNKKLKRKWVNGLRGGNYTQTAGVFRCGDRFCALGVLQDIAGIASEEDCDTHDLMNQILGDGITSDIIIMNDDEHKTFSEIADWIEEYL